MSTVAAGEKAIGAPDEDDDVSATCPSYASGVSSGSVASDKPQEVSGIAASRRNKGVYWIHNDAGNAAEVYAITVAGADRGTVKLSGVSMNDWEDIAAGAGPDPALSYVYVGDIGDNDENRSKVAIYRFPEPEISLTGGAVKKSVTPERLDIVYPDGPHNAEALLLDPVSKDLFIVTKNSGPTDVFRVPSLFTNGSKVTAQKVATFTPIGGAVSGGDISPDGKAILIRTDDSAMFWRRDDGVSVAQAMLQPHCVVPTKKEGNGEAIAFRVDKSGYVTVSEGEHQPVYFFAPK
ncbi:hypothetical protein LVJ94_48340 [Pendulispora rubella]|uniref:PE-PGRS family protein n=1 Tax=Pendulispora rubella TaxID=2741070 RepID=A0ABZ2L7J6_9BACT